MKKFIKDLTSSKFYHKLFETDEVLMIWVGGSRIFKCVDDYSDYDIVVLTRDTCDHHAKEYLRYHGENKVHWYFNCIDTYFNPIGIVLSDYIALTQLNYIYDDAIIYKNSEYINLIDDFLSKQKLVARLGDILGYQYRKELIESVVSDGFISDRNKTKHLYMLCAMYYDITKQNLDIEFLTKIKRIRWQEIDEKYLKQCVDILGKFKDYMQNIDIDEEVKKIKEKLVTK